MYNCATSRILAAGLWLDDLRNECDLVLSAVRISNLIVNSLKAECDHMTDSLLTS